MVRPTQWIHWCPTGSENWHELAELGYSIALEDVYGGGLRQGAIGLRRCLADSGTACGHYRLGKVAD